MRTINNLVCTAPFPFTGIQTEKRGSGLVQAVNLTGLVGLKVLVDGPEGIKTADIVWVPGRDCKAPYGQQQHKLPDGRVCIFVPLGSVVMTGAVPEPELPIFVPTPAQPHREPTK